MVKFDPILAFWHIGITIVGVWRYSAGMMSPAQAPAWHSGRLNAPGFNANPTCGTGRTLPGYNCRCFVQFPFFTFDLEVLPSQPRPDLQVWFFGEGVASGFLYQPFLVMSILDETTGSVSLPQPELGHWIMWLCFPAGHSDLGTTCR